MRDLDEVRTELAAKKVGESISYNNVIRHFYEDNVVLNKQQKGKIVDFLLDYIVGCEKKEHEDRAQV